MSASINENSNGMSLIRTVPWKAILVVMLALTAILGLWICGVVLAADETESIFFPVIASPQLPGRSGRLVYTINSGTGREIVTINPDGSNQVRLTDNNAVDDMPYWSADGSLIAFTSDRRQAGYYEIYVMNRDGSAVTRLTDGIDNASPQDDNSPSFSPAGDKIAFTSNRNGAFQIFVMNSNGSDQKPLTADDYESGSPEWSPDGSKIVFASSKVSGIEIYTMNPDGSNMRRLTTGGGPDFSPSWSPDGKQIVFTSLRDGERHIYVMNADGSQQERLTAFYSDWPDWSPDGARIVFTLREGNNINSSGFTAGIFASDARQYFAHSSSAEEDNTNLYTMKPDGSDQQPLTQTPFIREDRGNWGP